MSELFDVIAETNELLVLNKPAGLVCHPTKGDAYSSLVSRVRLYLPHSPETHLINRLDRETSGIVLVAKNSEASARMRKLWESRAVHKEYLAIVHGRLLRSALVDAPLGQDHSSKVAIKDTVRPDGVPAATLVFPLRTVANGAYSVVRLILLTGRKHQIRIHLAHIGHPVVGDKLYGGDENLYLSFVTNGLTAAQRALLVTDHHCLHAAHLSFGWLGVNHRFYAEPEPWFARLAADQVGPR